MPLKRTPLKRRTPLRNGKPITAKTAPRRSKIRPVNRERKAKMHARNFGEEANRARAMPCLVYYAMARDGLIGGIVDVTCRGPVEAAHVTARGMGAVKGGRFDIVPLCSAHHREAGEAGTSQRSAFEQRYGVDIRRIADDLALEHPRPLGIRGLADTWAHRRAAAIEAMGKYVAGVTEDELLGWAFQDDDYGADALLGWVHREMGRAVLEVLFDSDEEAHEAMVDHIGAQLGGAFCKGDGTKAKALAWTLCEAAAERFGGWLT